MADIKISIEGSLTMLAQTIFDLYGKKKLDKKIKMQIKRHVMLWLEENIRIEHV